MLGRTLLLLALLFAASAAHSKALHWRAVEVDAQLDGNGLLHVVETQTYVFDGDWNGVSGNSTSAPGISSITRLLGSSFARLRNSEWVRAHLAGLEKSRN